MTAIARLLIARLRRIARLRLIARQRSSAIGMRIAIHHHRLLMIISKTTG